jgi:hypothetical protein
MNMQWIRHEVMRRGYQITVHALDECRDEDVSLEELEYILLHGRILETYEQRNDPRGERGLILGYSEEGTAVHVVVTVSDGVLKVVTAYLPKPPKWLDEKTRRKE